MKQALLLGLIAFCLASCGQGSEDAAKKGDYAVPEGGDGGEHHVDYNGTLISLTEANNLIDNYHHYVDARHDSTQALSFMLDANMLREYLNSDSSLEKLDIYLARTNRDADGQMRLVYIGARNISTTDTPMYKEIPIVIDGAENMLDHALPCPKCDRDRLHYPNTNQ